MSKILIKEMKLSALLITYLFIAFGLLAMIPGYPILLGAFFVCLGLFQTYRNYRESNDIVYSSLLPIAKSDIVRGKFQFAIMIEMLSFLIMAVCTIIRMTALKDSVVYRANALMTANLVFLGFALVIFAVFNLVFIGGFFKTAYYFTKPFILFIILSFIIVSIAEALHYVPGLQDINSFGFDNLSLQIAFLVGGIMIYNVFTLLAFKLSIERFEKIDL